MKLTEQQLKEFDKEGYLFMPGMFSSEEAALLAEEAKSVYASDRKEVWREVPMRYPFFPIECSNVIVDMAQ